MTSRLLRVLDDRIKAFGDTPDADCARANKALHLFRLGRGAEAGEILSSLRSKYETRPDVRVSCWLHLAEAISFLYFDPAGSPIDRLRRCLALADASGNLEMQALASAWLAHLAYGSYDAKELEDRLRSVITRAAPDNHQALARAKLIGAVALHLCGRYDMARRWYAQVRKHAEFDGDEATVSALIHNVACMGVANQRQLALDPRGGDVVISGAPSALHEARSSANYDDLIGTSSLSTWTPILQAQALALQGDAMSARAIYEENLRDAESQGLRRVMSYMRADVAWCRSRTGQLDEAHADAIAAEDLLGADVLIDDRAATHSRLGQVYELLGKAPEAGRHMELASIAWKEFRAFQVSIVNRLEPLLRIGV